MLTVHSLIRLINKAAMRQQGSLVIPYNKSYLAILELLVKGGFILSFNILKDYVVIQSRGFSFTCLSASRVNSLKTLKRTQRREGGVASYMLYTDRGVCLGISAIAQHIGGKIITRLF
jgi:ribosomal protein S8